MIHTSKFSLRSSGAYLRAFMLFFLLVPAFQGVKATHIAGAELVYRCIGTSQYEVNLTLFRDCFSSTAFDNSITLYVFDATNNSVYNTYDFYVPSNTPSVNPPNWGACVGGVTPFCVDVAVYSDVISLPANNAGYYIAWARCCRNNSITNLASPQCEGVTFLAHIPGYNTTGCNSMPVFDNYPPIFLCAGQPLYFDHSATDIDGDSLVYSISNPYTGINLGGQGAGNPTAGACGSTLSPVVGPGNPMGPEPYRNVVFSPGFSALNPFGAGSISINSQTGYLVAQPMNPGIYVLAISVKEYRNGVLLSENKRDFQFHVVACLPQGTPPVITRDLSGLTVSNDTIFVPAAQPFCYDFTISDSLLPSTILVNPVSVAFGGNGGFPPPYATLSLNGNTPPVDGTICWNPSCSQIGQTIEFIITARDTNDCPNYNVIFDTLYVHVLPSPNAPPLVAHNISAVPVIQGDTIYADVQENFCFEFQIIDTLGNGNLSSGVRLVDSLGNLLPTQPSLNTTTVGDTIFGTVCFNTACFYGAGYMFIIEGRDDYQCPPLNQSADTVWLSVQVPDNPPPVTSFDLVLNPTSGDTILASVHSQFCFNFEVEDTSGTGDSLFFTFVLEDLSGNFAGEPASYSAFVSGNSIAGEICWTPRCVNVDQVFRIIISGEQINHCGITNFDRDTVYVRVSEPIKPVPLISHDTGSQFPGNSIIRIEDNASFCFTFELQDTVTPTHLAIQTQVKRQNGLPYSGSLPVVTYQTQNDSLIQGTLCWEVDCDFANETFTLLLIGRDTFDCHPGNIVYDSVMVIHTENQPGPIQICKVSVQENDAGIEVNWNPSTAPDIAGFVLLRRRSDEIAFTVLDTVYNPSALSLVDVFTEVDDYSYCYQILPLDRCGNTAAASDENCSILLAGEAGDFISNLSWSQYIGFPAGVDRYQVFSRPESQGSLFNLIFEVSPPASTYSDANIQDGRVCYRLRATEAGIGCGGESWSNEVCVEFPPLMFLPNAFSPNGDQLNDFFTAGGLFFEEFDLQIWDRWGKLLFQTRDAATGWDGKINGSDAPEGVYVFRVYVRGFDGTELKQNGSVTLIR